MLIALILIVFSMYNVKEAEKRKKELQEQAADSLHQVKPPAPAVIKEIPQAAAEEDQPGKITAVPDSAERERSLKNDFGVFHRSATGEPQTLVLENDLLKVVFSNKGGSVKSVELKKYQTHDSLPLILFASDENQTNIQLPITNSRVINTQDLFFTGEKTASEVIFRLPADEGQYIEQRYAFHPEKKYVIDYTVNLVGLDKVIPNHAGYLNFYMKRDLRKVEMNKTNETNNTGIFYKIKDDDVESLSTTEADNESVTTASWVSFKQQFFNSTLIYPPSFSSGTLKSSMLEAPQYLKSMEASLVLPFNGKSEENYKMSYYFGPNHYQTLKSLNIDLEEIVMVTGFMSWVSVINKWLIIPVFNWLEKFTSNYGLIILILTVLIKLILFPLSYKSFKSMAMMKLLQPELTELKEKYKDDQQKFATEQWKLYQKAGVNPMGGCLPQLLQFPILIAMYYFFPTSIELRQESFLWANDLSTYDSIWNFPPGFEIPFYGDHVSLFTLLMAASSILYAATQPQMTTGPASMKYMPYIFPIMLLGIFNSLPAALTYYYFLANITSYLQQWITKKFIIDEEALHRKMQENKKKPVKKSGWTQRLEEMAKQQREMQKQRKK